MRRTLTAQSGMVSLLSVIAMMGVLGIIVWSFQQHIRSTSEFMSHTLSRQVVAQLQGEARSPGAILNSATRDAGLQACLVSRTCDTGWTPFSLWSRANRRVTNQPNGERVMYNRKTGAVCTPRQSQEVDCVLTATSEYRFSGGENLEVRMSLLDTRPPARTHQPRRPKVLSPVSLSLSAFPRTQSCPAGQALTGMDENGRVVCQQMLLPSGGGPWPLGSSCGGNSSSNSLTEDGRGDCGAAQINVNVTNSPSGFFVQGGDGRFSWGECNDILGLNGFFPNEDAALTCRWLNSPMCTIYTGYRVPRTCSRSCNCDSNGNNCSTCYYDCSYCESTGSYTESCGPFATSHRAGTRSAREEERFAFNCSSPWNVPRARGCTSLPDCHSRSCAGTVIFHSSSGSLRCYR